MSDETETNDDKPLSLETLHERIQFLEAQNSGLKRVGGLALILLLLVGGLFVSQVWRDLRGLASGGLVLLDDDRKDVAAITVTPKGNTALIPVGIGGVPHLQTGHEEFNGLGIYDAMGRLRIVLGTTPDGERVVIGVLGPDGRPVWAPLVNGKGGASAPNPGGAASPAPNSAPTPAMSGSPTPATSPIAPPSSPAPGSPTVSPSP